MYTTINSQDQKAVSMIKDLRKIAFKNESNLHTNHQQGQGTIPRNRFSEDYKTLGFSNIVDPTQDFQRPPGLLALDLMNEFATNNPESFNKLVMESSCRGDGCPFASSSIGLVKVLCDVFNIDKDPKYHDDLAKWKNVYEFILERNQNFLYVSFWKMFQNWH